MATAASALANQLIGRVTYVNIESGGYTYNVFTLDGALSLWAAQSLGNPAGLGGVDPVQMANGFATNYCQSHPGVDCSQQGYLVAAFGQSVRAAIRGEPIPPLPAPPLTPIGSNVVADVAHSDTPPIPPPPPPIDISVPSPALQALLTTTPTPATTPAPVTPAAPTPTMPTAEQQHVSVPLPKDIFSGLLGTGGGAAGGAEAGTWEAPVTFGISIVVGAILGALFGSLFGGSDTKALQAAINNVAQSLAKTADALERFSWSIADGLGKTWQAIAYIWDYFLDALWTYMKRLWQLLQTLVDKVVPGIINVIRDLRKFLDHIYTTYILKAMRYLLLIRQVLNILRALHIPIAARLDKILGQIQGALFAPFMYLLRSLNGYGGWFNFILTSNLILQRPLFLNTMYAYQADWINMFYTAQSGQQGPVGTLGPAATGTSSFANWLSDGATSGGSTDTAAQVMTTAEACAWLAVFVSSGGGELAPTAEQTQILLHQYLGI